MFFQSKTVLGLLVILGISCGMALIGKLTPELVDVIKWIGTAYMSIRGIANYMEGKNANSRSQDSSQTPSA